MKKKKPNPSSANSIDAELLRMYMMGATNPGFSNKGEWSADIIDLHLEKIHRGRPEYHDDAQQVWTTQWDRWI